MNTETRSLDPTFPVIKAGLVEQEEVPDGVMQTTPPGLVTRTETFVVLNTPVGLLPITRIE
jgi:hypothetical protein